MFLLLTQAILLILLIGFVYFLITHYIPQKSYTQIGFIAILALLGLLFFNPYSNQVFASIANIIALFFKPLGWVLFLLLAGCKQIKKNTISEAGTACILAALIIFMVCSIPFVAYKLAQQAEQESVQIANQIQSNYKIGEQNPSAMILLAENTTKPNLPYRNQIELTDRGDRILYTAQLYQEQMTKGNRPFLIISSSLRAELSGGKDKINEGNDISKILIKWGIPSAQIIIDNNGIDFHKSAIEVKKILTSKKILDQPTFLITSAYNMKRAYLAFASEKIKIIPKPANFYTIDNNTNPRRKLTITDFVPSSEAFSISNKIIAEYATSIYYFIRGWVTPAI
jgi:uncharacterized SAM-binding protein YcdF (DUF218 family)